MTSISRSLLISVLAGSLAACASGGGIRSSSDGEHSLAGINDRNAPVQPATSPDAVPGDAAYWNTGITGTSIVAPSSLTRSQITSDSVSGWARNSMDEGRLSEVRNAAASLGAQAGLADRIRQIQSALMNRATQYDRAYDFSRLMIEPGLLPPVITEGRDAYHQENDNEARAADRVFRIERPARIVSANPTWRTYLLADPTPALAPSAAVMPRNGDERRVWDEFAARGWDQGVAQADATFKSNLARLNQDFQGMMRFKMLYEQGLVNMPRLRREHLGTTGGGDELALGDRTIRISSKALLDANSRNWNIGGRLPATAPHDTSRGAGPKDYPRPGSGD